MQRCSMLLITISLAIGAAAVPSAALGQDTVSPDVSGITCISNATPCVTVPIEFLRTDVTSARGATVTIQLGGGLELCDTGVLLNNFTQGSWLTTGTTTIFEVIDNSGGSYTVDQAILGSTGCGPTTGGTLFSIDVTGTADGTGTITVTAVDVRNCANPFGSIPGTPGAAGNITVDFTAPASIPDLGAAQLKSGNGNDGTTDIDLSWTEPAEPDADSITIYRKGYGDYPEYDDGIIGEVPATPATPAAADAAGWDSVTALAATATSYADEPTARDYWYYVAFVTDDCGNIGAVSNQTGGTLNYHLGDISDGVTPGDGNNILDGDDISALGAAYGTTDPGTFYRNWADIGPTAGNSTNGLPDTDDAIQFEDLIVFAINFGTVTKPAPGGAGRNELEVLVAELPPVGEELRVTLNLASTGAVQGVSVPLTWNPEVVEPVGHEPGEFAKGGVVLSPAPGTLDAAALGSPFAGEGEIGTVRFRVIAEGDPGIGLGEVLARDPRNSPIALPTRLGADRPVLPVATRLFNAIPNPFRAGTRFQLALGEAGAVEIRIFGLGGGLVRTLVDGYHPAGLSEVEWDGRDDRGREVAAGTYLVRFSAPGHRGTQSIVRLR